MMALRVFCTVVFFFASLMSMAQEEFELKEGDTTFIMKKYYLVLLKANPDKEPLDSVTIAEIQKSHLDNINRLAKAGKIDIAGPFGDDGELRGIFIMSCESLEEAISLVETDPAIQRKRLLAEVHPWWGAKGSVLR